MTSLLGERAIDLKKESLSKYTYSSDCSYLFFCSFYDVIAQIPDPDVFNPPSACL